MDEMILKKLRVKEEMRGLIINKPLGYPAVPFKLAKKGEMVNFLHIFITSEAEFKRRFKKARTVVTKDCVLWISYPKSIGKQKFDINRDRLWDLAVDLGWHPVAQVALNDYWSAMRLKPNEPDVLYLRPGMKNK